MTSHVIAGEGGRKYLSAKEDDVGDAMWLWRALGRFCVLELMRKVAMSEESASCTTGSQMGALREGADVAKGRFHAGQRARAPEAESGSSSAAAQ